MMSYMKRLFIGNTVMFNEKVKKELNNNIEANSSVLLQIMSLGFKKSFIEYDKGKRIKGTSKWTLSKKIKAGTNDVASHQRRSS